MDTHIFTLPSGVECEVTELLGKHQDMLTRNAGHNFNEKLNKVLADVIVRVGSKKEIDDKFVSRMLSVDRRKALVEVRQYSFEFDPNFTFEYDYISKEGEKKMQELTVDLKKCLKTTPISTIDEEGNVVAAAYDEYEDIKRTHEITLPRSGKKVTFTMLDGVSESSLVNMSKASVSSHTVLNIRKPIEYYTSEKGNAVPLKLDLNRLNLKDIEYLRKAIKDVEGKVDTELIFEHPDALHRQPNEKEVKLDLLGILAFFFSSGAM